MKAEEIAFIQAKHNAAIVAQAGHGKTEMITDLVDKLPGKKLVLTHTNAGVSALIQRLAKKHVNREKYCLSTISSFCMKWCEAYPVTAGINPAIAITDSRFYSDQTCGTARILSHGWAREVIKDTYACVIVDEYQDCVVEQHQIFLEINKTVPVYILGDPLQSIFGWAGKPVSWNNIGFERVCVQTAPHRWERSNAALGQYLTTVRDILMPSLEGKRVRLSTIPNGTFIKRISPSVARGAGLYNEMNRYQSALYLTKWPQAQCSFSRQTGGIFQNDEPQNLNDLYNFAQFLDTDNAYTRTETIYSFIEECATQVNAELGSYKKHITEEDFDFSKIKKHPEFGKRILKLYQNHGYEEMLSVLEWIKANSTFRIFRRELFTELIRSIRFARDRGITINEAAQQIRMIPNNQSRYAGFKKLSSRAVLSKGLEFECVAINLEEQYTATEMYVAMTRAMKTIYFITDQDSVLLNAPQGI